MNRMSCICDGINYDNFNLVLKNELKIPINVNKVINESVCISIDLDLDENLSELFLNQNEILSFSNQKIGIYHLWVKEDYCVQHSIDKHLMLCVYVGKGDFEKRIKSHIKDKWEKTETLYISFYECENRIAKYLEQLFLDNYAFYLNKAENSGREYLKTIWDEERLSYGDDIDEYVERMEEKNPSFFEVKE